MTMQLSDRSTWIGRTDSGIVRQRLYDRGITGLGLSLLDPGASTWAKAIRNEPGCPFFYYDPHWDNLAGDGSALKARQRIDALLLAVGAKPAEPLMLDLEQCSKDYVTRLLLGSTSGRGLTSGALYKANPTASQPGRPIGYTNEPFKDGTVVPVDVLEGAGCHWFPQLYYGDMSPADGAAVALEVARWGFPADRVHPFYDGARVASDQRDGCYFVAERIPGVFVTSFGTVAEMEARRTYTKASLRAHYTQLARAA
jgi:hypothetical protein